MTRAYFLDTASFQPNAQQKSFWDNAYHKGVRGAIVKMSESTNYRNPYGWNQVKAAKAAGMKVSGYHFAKFIGNGNQARAEAQYAIATANSMGIEHDSIIVLDYELRLGYQSANTLAAIVFCQAVKDAGFKPAFYSYSGMRELWDYEAVYRATGAILWIAAYPGNNYAPDYSCFPSISTHTSAWQWTDNFMGMGVDGSVDFTGEFTMAEKVTSGGSLDSVTFNQDNFTVNGWFASDRAQGKTNAFVIITNDKVTEEYGRVKVNVTSRPDVAKTYPDIPNGNQSGFSATFKYDERMKGKKLAVIFRYTDDPVGNGNAVDYTTLVDMAKSYASLDSTGIALYSNQMQVSGWFASDLSLGLTKRFLILYDSEHKRELQRVAIKASQRDDVAKAYPSVYGADQSGFSGAFAYHTDLVGHKLQIIARYSDDVNGEGHKVDYWFEPFNGPALPVMDGKTAVSVRVHSFSAKNVDNDLIELNYK